MNIDQIGIRSRDQPNSLSAALLLNIFLSFEVGIAHAIANFKWKENTSSLKN